MQNWLEVFKFPSVERTTYDRYECTARNQIYPYIGDKVVGLFNSDIDLDLEHTFAEIREISDKWNESLQEKNKFLSAKKGTATEFWSSHHEYDNAIEEYRILSGYLARIEHFALGVNTGIYDVKVTERAATAYLTMLYKKLEPLILAKNKGKNNSSSENKYHTEFMKLVSALKKLEE